MMMYLTARKFSLSSLGKGEEISLPKITILNDYARLFLAGSRHLVLTTGQAKVGQEKLELLSSDGGLRWDVGLFESNSYIPAAGIMSVGEEDSLFAVALQNRPSLCQSDFPIVLISSAGEVTRTDWGVAAPPGFVSNQAQGIEVHDLWWDGSRTLHATIASWTCDGIKQNHHDKKVVHSTSKLWKLERGTWVPEGDFPATVVRPVGKDGRAVLAIPDCYGEVEDPDPQTYCNVGNLQLFEGSHHYDIANGVLMLYAPPPVSLWREEATIAPGSRMATIDKLKGARVPSLCQHPEGKLVRGKLPGIDGMYGFVRLAAVRSPERDRDLVAVADITGDGKDEVAAVLECTQGGVSWPESIVVYDESLAIVGQINLGHVTTSAKAAVEKIEGGEGRFSVRWISYEGASFCVKTWTAQVHVKSGSVQLADLTQLNGALEPC
ncbi:hypothetical protein FXN61_00525 [Lentzea sp. PSKA42]|uniref:PQQ-like domain-containing protein n=1 Tax=Lentzea indica TaxID=2604800 RepID=A0ABX1F985_9PSEU|nr:hypothetical protein [Lentzea indica]